MNQIRSLSAQAVNERTKRGDEFVLLDVREPFEVAVAALPRALCIPMAEVPERLDELDRERDVVVMCHHGIRSARVCEFLQAHGFEHAINLSGGIDAWSIEVDSSVPRY